MKNFGILYGIVGHWGCKMSIITIEYAYDKQQHNKGNDNGRHDQRNSGSGRFLLKPISG